MKKENILLLVAITAIIYFLTKKKEPTRIQAPEKINGLDNNIGVY